MFLGSSAVAGEAQGGKKSGQREERPQITLWRAPKLSSRFSMDHSGQRGQAFTIPCWSVTGHVLL